MGIGLIFPGQGAQYVGQGKEWFEAFPESRKTFEETDRVLGFALSKICFEGPEEKLQSTDIAQPAIFATSAAVLRVLITKGIVKNAEISLTAGLSLGEYSALYAAGSLRFADALRLVRLRGELMQSASTAMPSGMSSILGLSREDCEAACQEAGKDGIVAVANLNSPGQVVISGQIKALEAAEALCKQKGAKRAIRLQVAGAFHSEVMRPAAEGLAKALAEAEIRTPAVPFLSNVTGEELKEPAQIREALAKQLCSPVLWEKSMRMALARGVTSFVEVSPGSVLKGLLRKIDSSALCQSYDKPADLSAAAQA